MSRTARILLRIKSELQVRGDTIEELVAYCDRYKSGFIPVDTLQRGLLNFGITIRNQEFQELLLDLAEQGQVPARKFINAVKNVSANDIPQHGDVSCQKQLYELANYLKLHQCTLHDVVRPFDRLNRGTVTIDDFIRAFQNSTFAPIIAKEFCDERLGLIRYTDIDHFLENIPVQTKKLEPESLKKAIAQLVAKRCDIRECFEMYDRVHCGNLQSNIFIHVLSQNVQLQQAEYQEIARYYSDNKYVNYLDLTNEVENQLMTKEVNSSATVLVGGRVIDINEIIRRLKEHFEIRKIDALSLFPPNKEGLVSQYTFGKILLANQSNVSIDDINALSQYYDAGNNLVSYKAFAANFARVKAAPPKADVSNTLTNIRQHLSSHQLKLRPMCLKFDRENVGTIPASQFIVALQSCGILLSSEELDALTQVYATSVPGEINYFRVCMEVEDPTIRPRQQQSEENAIQPPRQQGRPREYLPPAPQHVIKVVALIVDCARNLELDLMNEFQYRDRKKQGRISESDYIRLMTSLGHNFHEDELYIVYNYYSSQKSLDFDFLSFMNDVANLKPQEIRETPELVMLLRRYRAFSLSRMVDSQDIFRRFDPSRTGYILREHLMTALGSSGFHITKEEADILAEAYCDEVMPGKFVYRKMDERASQEKVNPNEIRMILNPKFATELTDNLIESALIEIREKLRNRRRNSYSVFGSLQEATISPRKFEDMLNDAGVILLKQQTDILVKKYTNGDMFNFDWRSFCQDCEGSSLIGGRE